MVVLLLSAVLLMHSVHYDNIAKILQMWDLEEPDE